MARQTHEQKEFGLNELPELFDTCLIKGTITDIDKIANTADIDTDHYGSLEDIPFFYHCEDETTVDDGWRAFEVDDEVMVLAENAASGASPDSPSVDLSIIGFWDGKPHRCITHYLMLRYGTVPGNYLYTIIDPNTGKKANVRDPVSGDPITFPATHTEVANWRSAFGSITRTQLYQTSLLIDGNQCRSKGGWDGCFHNQPYDPCTVEGIYYISRAERFCGVELPLNYCQIDADSIIFGFCTFSWEGGLPTPCCDPCAGPPPPGPCLCDRHMQKRDCVQHTEDFGGYVLESNTNEPGADIKFAANTVSDFERHFFWRYTIHNCWAVVSRNCWQLQYEQNPHFWHDSWIIKPKSIFEDFGEFAQNFDCETSHGTQTCVQCGSPRWNVPVTFTGSGWVPDSEESFHLGSFTSRIMFQLFIYQQRNFNCTATRVNTIGIPSMPTTFPDSWLALGGTVNYTDRTLLVHAAIDQFLDKDPVDVNPFTEQSRNSDFEAAILELLNAWATQESIPSSDALNLSYLQQQIRG